MFMPITTSRFQQQDVTTQLYVRVENKVADASVKLISLRKLQTNQPSELVGNSSLILLSKQLLLVRYTTTRRLMKLFSHDYSRAFFIRTVYSKAGVFNLWAMAQ